MILFSKRGIDFSSTAVGLLNRGTGDFTAT